MNGINDIFSFKFSDPNSIGYNVVEQLALKGATVFVGARSLEKVEGAISRLKKANPSIPAENLKPLVMDLNNLKEVQIVAQSFAREQPRLDILVNNAGVCVVFTYILTYRGIRNLIDHGAKGWLALWIKMNMVSLSLSIPSMYVYSSREHVRTNLRRSLHL